jgi:hypothetical protein
LTIGIMAQIGNVGKLVILGLIAWQQLIRLKR